MLLEDLDYPFPEDLIATKPQWPPRVLVAACKDKDDPKEVSFQDALELFQKGDVLVINESKVVKRKIEAKNQEGKTYDILFLEALSTDTWSVLLPASKFKKNEVWLLPEGVEVRLLHSHFPQTIQLSQTLEEEYFFKYGRMPLPPYIEKARGEQKQNVQDESWYQTAWARVEGSVAAPTASLHFRQEDLEYLEKKGLEILKVCLHVGLGTFEPVRCNNLNDHKMHREKIFITKEVVQKLNLAKEQSRRIWALGTTSCRSLESLAQGLLKEDPEGNFYGDSDLMLKPGSHFHYVNALITNFHQPKTTLMALVAAFSHIDLVKKNYTYAVQNHFRLFSYGDMSIWIR